MEIQEAIVTLNSTEEIILLGWAKVSNIGIYIWIWYDKMYKS